MYDKIFLQGGGKLLVVISWSNKNSNDDDYGSNSDDTNTEEQTSNTQSTRAKYNRYQVLFNGKGVPATEIHPGVLRCLVPGKNIIMLHLIERS